MVFFKNQYQIKKFIKNVGLYFVVKSILTMQNFSAASLQLKIVILKFLSLNDLFSINDQVEGDSSEQYQ